LDKGKRHKSNLSTTGNRPYNTNHWILVASISSLTVLLSILVLYYVEAKASKSEDSPSDLPYYTESVVLDVDVTESPKCVLSCDSTPRLKEMLTVLETLMDWKEFGINLGIEYHEIKKIKKENKLINDSKIKLYNYWLNADTAASWQKVINALERMQLKTLSSEIRRKYCSQTCNSDAVHS
uniref:Death domain-containing protein n=1 Tax=Amphimedon queenslandica TaxID=400682 RepID=A0A1X7SZX3_AMPQE